MDVPASVPDIFHFGSSPIPSPMRIPSTGVSVSPSSTQDQDIPSGHMEIPGTVFGLPEITNRISLINNDEGQKTAKHTPRRLIATPIGGFGEVLNATTGGNEKQGEYTKSVENLIEKSITEASQEICGEVSGSIIGIP